MNYLFVLQSGPLEIRGLVSPGELPDVVLTFYREASRWGATPKFQHGGILIASRDGIQVTLELISTHRSIPSKLLEDVLVEMMEQAFR